MDKNSNAVAVFDKLAVLYQSKFMDVSLYAKTLNLLCELVEKKDASILELACGPGNITKYLLDQNPQFKILGIDLAPKMIELAKANNPTASFQVMDCRNLAAVGHKFDAIMCGFCLPYLSKEETTKLITDAAQLLNPKGLLYLSTMEDDYKKSGLKRSSSGDEIFMHFYTLDLLESILTKNHFEIVHMERIISKNEDLTVTDLVIIGQLNK